MLQSVTCCNAVTFSFHSCCYRLLGTLRLMTGRTLRYLVGLVKKLLGVDKVG